MLEIYITRHGQDKDNVAGILNGHRNQPLTELGKKQARELGLKIKDADITFDAIYSSPLNRTLTTAKTVADIIEGPDPIVINDLIERDFGIMTGKKISQIKEICLTDILQADVITYFTKPEGGESFDDLLIRAKKVLELINRNHKSGKILLVTHGDTGKIIYAEYYDLPWQDVLTQFHFGNSELLLLSENSDSSNAHVFETEQYNH